MSHQKKISILGMVMLLLGGSPIALAGDKCVTVKNGSVTINKVTKVGLAPYETSGNTYMLEISGTNGTTPVSVRFKLVNAPCDDCTAIEKLRVRPSQDCEDNAHMAMALGKPLQFVENGDGGLCDIATGSTLKLTEIRQLNSPATFLPAAACAVGSLNGIYPVFFPDDPID